MDDRTMRAAVIQHFGGPETFEIAELPIPKPEGDEVLIRVVTAGVGIWDAQIRAGEWGDQGAFPLVLGTDGYGIVEGGGPASPFPVGERVWAYNYGGKKGGFYAEYACVPAACVAHAPPRLHEDVLGGAPTVAVTAWTGIRRILEVESSDVVIVHGASGPVGISAVQFAAWTHARVIAVASHDADVLRELGASEIFDDRDAGGSLALADAARRATKLLLLAPWPTEMTAALKGLIIAYPNGVDAPKSVEAAAFDGVPDRQLWDQVDSQMNAHRFVLPIAAAFPLDCVPDAHASLAQHRSAGKIILRVGQS